MPVPTIYLLYMSLNTESENMVYNREKKYKLFIEVGAKHHATEFKMCQQSNGKFFLNLLVEIDVIV